MENGLILVRHANVAVDTAVPASEWTLSENGRSRATRLATRLRAYGPTRIATSRERKARETGARLAAALGLPCSAVDNLHEHDRTGVPFDQDRAAFERKIAALFAQPEALVFGRETAVQTRTRVETAVRLLITTYPQDTLITVTHGTAMTLLISHYNPTLNPFDWWRSLPMPCAAVLQRETFQLHEMILP